ncbi:hypothetical protein TrVGV298_008117 [Trichoderma virens]|nr:hypothetical protein TrVGV298_008117 [Trichoderma virens]
MAQAVALILGYGPNVGFDVAEAFAAQDFSDPSSIHGIFSKVINELGHPSVVVYNASSFSLKPSTSLEQQIAAFQCDNNINIVSAYVAAHLATKSFALLQPESSKTFIYTGNKLPFMVVRPLLSQGVGKAGSAHLMHYLAEEHKDSGYKFYFADERKPDGDPVYSDIDGPAHAAFYTELAKQKAQGPWNATFVKGRGYVEFSEAIVNDSVTMKLDIPGQEK